ncbi:hypothetical protein HOB10_02705 [Candidatus Parcubacteria bacterium]|jgi:hypothetical protein|nr:hypothetical protein [Candidatus Parcubacteria bacterium]
MAWASFKDAAHRSLDEKGISTQVQESLVLKEANYIINNFFDQADQEKARAIYWKDSILTIAVLCDNLFEEIDSQKEQFINILNNRFEDNIVEELRFLN